jgi:hypothetical protein
VIFFADCCSGGTRPGVIGGRTGFGGNILPRNRHGIQLIEKRPMSIGEETWQKVAALLKQHVPASRDVTSSHTEINFSETKRKRALEDGRESD